MARIVSFQPRYDLPPGKIVTGCSLSRSAAPANGPERRPIEVGDLLVRIADGIEGVVTAVGSDQQPWWERPYHARNLTKLQVKWLPLGPQTWLSRRTEGKRWRRASGGGT